MSTQLVPVILAGGSGTRLWPLSRKQYPKQFLSFGTSESLLQQTIKRADSLSFVQHILIVCNEEYRFLVEEQVRECTDTKYHILLETEGKNTAPACALAVLYGQSLDKNINAFVMPSDHIIDATTQFRRAVHIARHWADRNYLVTFGIDPTSPETAYGYIERSEQVECTGGNAYKIAKFIEKPNLSTAEHFCTQGGYFWNSGMFLFRNKTFISELERYAPDVLVACNESLSTATRDRNFIRPNPDAWSKCRSVSIDYGVMEHTDNAVVVPLPVDWNDVGSWSGVAGLFDPDENGNVTHGDTILEGVKNSCVYADKRLVTALGVNKLIIVETADAVLVADKDKDQSVKLLVEQLSANSRPEVDTHTRVHRPWGSFEGLAHGQEYQVKRLVLSPAESISLQLHHYRAEHWIVVKGRARVTRGDETFTLQPNESTYIPKKTLHKLQNDGAEDLEVIEVQTGSYLGEDDIERFEDRYGRA